MSSLITRARSALSFALTNPRVVHVLTGLYVAAGLAFVLTDYTLNDEGVLIHYWAKYARQGFLPVFFFQKVKPTLCLVYLPFSGGGLHATLVAHVVLSSMAIPLITSTARTLGHRLPNLPALVLAASPLYLYGGAAGVSNVDGAVGVILVGYLLAARPCPLVAGIVAGLLPWVRFELALFSVLFGLYMLLSKQSRSALLGLAIFPVLYAAAGAWYHQDILWLADFPPSIPIDTTNSAFRFEMFSPRYFLEPLLALTPAAALVAAVSVRRLLPLERGALLYGVVAVAALHLFQMFQLGNFEAAPRYSLHVLPILALLISRALEPCWERERVDLPRLVAVLLLACWLTTRQLDTRLVTPLLLAYLVIVAALRRPAGTLALAQVIILVLAGPLLPLRVEIGRRTTAPYLDPILHWLELHPADAAGPIYTNAQLLAPFLEARGRLPRAGVFFVAGSDMAREHVTLTDARNRQREYLERLAERSMYGKFIIGPITPEDLPPDSILALRVESRLAQLLPDQLWAPRLEVLAGSSEYRIARLRQPATNAPEQ